MQKIDRDKFLFAVQGPLGALNDDQKTGLNQIIDFLGDDVAVNDLRWAAYILATTYHETAHTFQPIEEIGKGQGHEYGKPDATTGHSYYGRGYVQLTWKNNYATMSHVCGVDLVVNPSLALNPAYAYKIMSWGMRHGAFTGVSLNRYFNENIDDPINARKIINGIDCAEKIAGYHKIFLNALQPALEGNKTVAV